jgi:hypothetical protein
MKTLPFRCTASLLLAAVYFGVVSLSQAADGNETSSPRAVINPRDIIKFQTRRTPNPTHPPAELKVPIDKFFNTLKTGDSTKAYTELLAGTRLAERKENLQIFIEKTDQAQGIYGKLISFEIYDNYNVGSSLMVLTYITNHPMQPLRWRLVYYKPEKAWMLIDVRVDDVLEDLVD